MSARRFDLHQSITDRIILAIEANPGAWQRPWQVSARTRRPMNVASGNAYRGINTIALWVEAQLNGYGSHRWGTYRQWSALGGQVRKGAKASLVVFYKAITAVPDEGDTSEEPERRSLIARASSVFNADQVDGSAALDTLRASTIEPSAAAEIFVTGTGAAIVHGGDRACYVPTRDQIRMPEVARFVGSSTSTAAEAYYSTLMHELTHWTGPPHRCDRQLVNRFGSDAYAMEELVAELGAAFLCADLGIASEVRVDHAQYLAHWLRVLKGDKRAIFTAAGKAAQAVDYLRGITSEKIDGDRTAVHPLGGGQLGLIDQEARP